MYRMTCRVRWLAHAIAAVEQAVRLSAGGSPKMSFTGKVRRKELASTCVCRAGRVSRPLR